MKKRKTLSLKSKRKATSDSVDLTNESKKTSSILSIGSGFQKKNKKTKKSGKTSKSSKTRIPPKKKQKNESNNKTRTKTKTTKLILEKFPSKEIRFCFVSSKEWNINLFGSEEEETNEASEDEKDSEVFFNATGIHCSKYYSCNAIYQFPENKLVFNGL